MDHGAGREVGDAGLEVVVVAGEVLTAVPLPAQGSITLGRGDECEVRIDSRSVSRRHAVLHVGPGLRIQDLGSRNGTFVRGGMMSADTMSTYPLRRLSSEVSDIVVGERVGLGTIPMVVRRIARSRGDSAANQLVVDDPAMQVLYDQAARAARGTTSVLILGETGVGKEVLARFLHEQSPRAGGPLLELNCAALPPSLLESELFGHEKNAFTGANQARPGLFEAADRGTVFLDEIGELPVAVQVKLLRVLEDRSVLRVGARAPRKLDIRFIAATNRDLDAAVGDGTFREDLLYRLNVVSFVIPPLRARVTEIAPLARRFLAIETRKLDRSDLRLSAEAVICLERYLWPGNVRELRNVIERAVLLSSGHEITPADLPTKLTSRAHRATAPRGSDSGLRPSAEHAEERQRIIEALERTRQNQTRAAELLGMSLRTLVYRLDEYSIPRPRKRR